MSANICNTCAKCARVLSQKIRLSGSSLNYQQTRGLKAHQEKTVRAMYWRGRSFDRVQFEPTRRSQWSEWNYRSEIYAFSRRLQENLSEDTLRQIFTHPSYAKDLSDRQAKLNLPYIEVQSNEGLAHKGQCLLTEYLKPYLRHTFNRMPEDGIVHITNYLSSDDLLADTAMWIGCKEIILSKEYPPEANTMANTVRALIAGIESEEPTKTRRFIADIIISYLNDKDIFDDVWEIPNPKETLNLILANSQLPAYEPRIMFETGAKMVDQCYVVGLYSNKKFLGSSAGETLKIAEHCAALDTLQNLFNLKEDKAPYVYGDASEKIDYDAHKSEHDYIKTWRFTLT